MSCVYHLRTVRFGTWFTPLLEGSFIARCKETRTELHLAENRWLPPHRVLFYFPKILVPNLTTKTSYQAPVKNYRRSSQATAAETAPALWYDAHHHSSVGSHGLVIRCWGWALAAAAWGATAEGRGAVASESATYTCCRHCRWKVWFWPALKSWTQWVDNFMKCGQEMGTTLRNINFSKPKEQHADSYSAKPKWTDDLMVGCFFYIFCAFIAMHATKAYLQRKYVFLQDTQLQTHQVVNNICSCSPSSHTLCAFALLFLLPLYTQIYT